MASNKVIGRLSLYRRLLTDHIPAEMQSIYSHQLAHLACVSPAQVRRDLMGLNYEGSPSKGYKINSLIDCISNELDDSNGQKAILVGIGNLGRSLLGYFHGRRPNLAISAAFDVDPQKVNRVMHRVKCHPLEKLTEVTKQEQASVGIITVPAAEAQTVANLMVEAGIKGILNYAPVPLRLPDGVFVEEQDMTMALEKVAYFARKGFTQTEKE